MSDSHLATVLRYRVRVDLALSEPGVSSLPARPGASTIARRPALVSEKHVPVVAMRRGIDVIGCLETETDGSLRLSGERYGIMRPPQSSDEAIARMRDGR